MNTAAKLFSIVMSMIFLDRYSYAAAPFANNLRHYQPLVVMIDKKAEQTRVRATTGHNDTVHYYHELPAHPAYGIDTKALIGGLKHDQVPSRGHNHSRHHHHPHHANAVLHQVPSVNELIPTHTQKNYKKINYACVVLD